MLTDFQAYGLHCGRSGGPGYHERRRSSCEQILLSAPIPPTDNDPNKYPHIFRDDDHDYPSGTTYYEYPALDFPYDRQNSRRGLTSRTPGGPSERRNPGPSRIITDGHKNIIGMGYHIAENDRDIYRANEIFVEIPSPLPEEPKPGRRGRFVHWILHILVLAWLWVRETFRL